MEAVRLLLERARRGESEALSQLYRHYVHGVFGYIATRVPERTIAEDLTSDVFLAMVENIYRLKATDEAGFLAWLLQIARTTVAGYYRKQKKSPVVLSLEPALDADRADLDRLARVSEQLSDPAYQAEVRDDWRQTVQAINCLTEEQRLVLVGRLILGYDVATVARMLGKKANAIKALQFRALNKLHALLNKGEGGINKSLLLHLEEIG
jgi:RNA polymerase sigma-70 factor (ECF subfamily)